MAVRTHITEGINLLRSASPNVSITTPPGTTPALLFAAARQLIRGKTENEREEKKKTGGRAERAQPLAAFPTMENEGKRTEKVSLYIQADETTLRLFYRIR